MMLLGAADWHAAFFWLFALFTCGFALAVLCSSNVVRMAFFLVISLGASAGLFFLAGTEFLGAMQLMIYVGGTLVLLIFGVMLTAQARFVTLKTPAGEWIVAVIVGGSLLALLLSAAFRVPEWTRAADRTRLATEDSNTTTQIGLALAGVRVDKLDAGRDTGAEDGAVRENSRSGYLLPFVIVSVHLLVVLIGAAYMARAKRRVPTADSGG